MDKYTLIESYLMNALSAEDKSMFEQRLKDDPSFAADVDAHAKMKASLDILVEEDVREVIEEEKKQISENVILSSQRAKPSLRRRYFGIAASLLILLAAWFWWNKPLSYDKAYLKYNKYPLAEITRSETDAENQDAKTLIYYAAHKLKEKGNYNQAFIEFQNISLDTDSKYQENAEWFMALVLLKTDKEKAISKLKTLAENPNHKYTKEINGILKDLGEND